MLNAKDNCLLNKNPKQINTDNDTFGDVCDEDDDNDGRPDVSDNCPLVENVNQADADGDNIGDVCDPDDDNDGVKDVSDNCPNRYNPKQVNTDGDKLGNVCDPDDDNDKIVDNSDNCPLVANIQQADTDGDGQGDACDLDDDADGIVDSKDNCPKIKNAKQINTDGDSQGDICDPDDDNDGIADLKDNCPLAKNPKQLDTDGDKQGNACDLDDDGDGDPDTHDCNPLDNQIYHGAQEVCDAVDHNCDGSIYQDDALGCTVYYVDEDEDGYGVLASKRCLCKRLSVWTVTDISQVDCAPKNKKVNPGATEVCDGIDNNCKSGIDEADAQGCKVYYFDRDQDGFGGPSKQCLCKPAGRFTQPKGGDCYDNNKLAYPGQTSSFAYHRGDGSFDHNCDYQTEPSRPTTKGSCNNACSDAKVLGWWGAVPKCGQSGKFLATCTSQLVYYYPYTLCTQTTVDVTMQCR